MPPKKKEREIDIIHMIKNITKGIVGAGTLFGIVKPLALPLLTRQIGLKTEEDIDTIKICSDTLAKNLFSVISRESDNNISIDVKNLKDQTKQYVLNMLPTNDANNLKRKELFEAIFKYEIIEKKNTTLTYVNYPPEEHLNIEGDDYTFYTVKFTEDLIQAYNILYLLQRYSFKTDSLANNNVVYSLYEGTVTLNGISVPKIMIQGDNLESMKLYLGEKTSEQKREQKGEQKYCLKFNKDEIEKCFNQGKYIFTQKLLEVLKIQKHIESHRLIYGEFKKFTEELQLDII